MIKNKLQCGIIRPKVEGLEHALELLNQDLKPLRSVLTETTGSCDTIQAEDLLSRLASFRREIAEYKSLRSGRRRGPSFRVSFVEDLPRRLIQARIAAKLTQKELASLLGLKKQQVQQYEAIGYASASLTRVIQIARTLGAKDLHAGSCSSEYLVKGAQ